MEKRKEKGFYSIILMIIFIVAYITSLVLACRNVEFIGLKITGASLVYPITYFLAIIYAERYGRDKAKMLFN